MVAAEGVGCRTQNFLLSGLERSERTRALNGSESTSRAAMSVL